MSEGSAAMPSRLAMEISGKLMEGEVVNRSKAQRVYRNLVTSLKATNMGPTVDDVKKFGWNIPCYPKTLWVLNNLTGKLTIISSVLLFYWSIPVSPPVEFETGLKIDEMS